jgi:protease IV
MSMTQSADAIIDRRSLRRKLTFWRVIALALVALGIAALANLGLAERTAPHIAKVRIEGPIHEDDDLLDRLDRIAKSDAVKGLIISVDSPGGTTAGGEAIFEAVRKVAEKKPVVAQVGTLAASAGYMIASAADHIVARQTSIVGSIGVLFQYPDISQLLTKLGVKIETIKSSPLKAEPNFFSPAPEEAKVMIRNMIMDSYNWFVDLIESRRPLDHQQALALADGSIYTGRQGLEKKLVDELGGEDEAVGWLKKKGVPDLQVIEWKRAQSGILGSLFSDSAATLLTRFWAAPEDSGALLLRQLGGERFLSPGLLSSLPADGTAQQGQ